MKGKEDELRKFFDLESAKAGADLSADDLVSIDQLRGMEEGQVLEGVFNPGGDVTLPYSFSISSKGNGSLELERTPFAFTTRIAIAYISPPLTF